MPLLLIILAETKRVYRRYYAGIVVGRITRFARPFIGPSVCSSHTGS